LCIKGSNALNFFGLGIIFRLTSSKSILVPNRFRLVPATKQAQYLLYNSVMSSKVSREEIIDAAISLLEKEGFHTFDLNKLAKKIQLKTAEIKKLFPDTNILIKESLKRTLIAGLTDNLEECVSHYMNKYEFLKQLFYMTLTGALKNPKIIKTHFYPSFISDNGETPIVKELHSFVEKTWEAVKPDIETEKQEASKRRLNQAIVSILFVAIFPQLLKPIDPYIWSDDLAKYVSQN